MLERLQHRLGLQTIPGVFFSSAAIAALFVALAIPFDQAVASSFGQLTGWVARNLGWFYILAVSSLLIFLLGLALSRYGSIRLGADDSRPDYSNLTWFTMAVEVFLTIIAISVFAALWLGHQPDFFKITDSFYRNTGLPGQLSNFHDVFP